MSLPFIHPRGWKCRIVLSNYWNNDETGPGRMALELIDWDNGSPVDKATVNIPEAEIDDPNEACIRNWSGGDGMLKALVDAGIATDTGRGVGVGFVVAPIVKINHERLKEFL